MGGAFIGQNIQGDPLTLFIGQLIVIIGTARLLTYLLGFIKQPPVVAKVLSGIILGPSVLGRIPGWMDNVFPDSSLPSISMVGNLGVVLYMFVIGMKSDPFELLKQSKETFVVGVSGVVLPFGLGAAASILLYQDLVKGGGSSSVSMVPFMLFIGLAMSITACFPVLARILADLHMDRSPAGALAIGAAAVGDYITWGLLLTSMALFSFSNPLWGLYSFLMILGYAVVLFVFVRPRIHSHMRRSSMFETGTVHKSLLALTFVAIFASAWIAEAIGVHGVFGAYLLGLIVPKDNGFALQFANIVNSFVPFILLPLYFTASGLRTDVRLLSSLKDDIILGIVLLSAMVGKLLGGGLAARSIKLPWRDSFIVGLLMNTRGLVELVVINLGLDAGFISNKIFTMMIIMTVVATFITSPLVSTIKSKEEKEKHVITEVDIVKDAEEKFEEGIYGNRITVVSHRMEDVPALALMTKITRPSSTSAVKFVDASDVSLDIMFADKARTAIEVDPLLKMYYTCTSLVGISTDARLEVSRPEDYCHELLTKVVSKEDRWIIFPMRPNAPVGLPLPPKDADDRLVLDTVELSKTPVLLLWDARCQSACQVNEYLPTRVLVIFEGGANDREALRLAEVLRGDEEMELKVVVMDNDKKDVQDIETLSLVTGESFTPPAPVPEGPKRSKISRELSLRAIDESGIYTRQIRHTQTSKERNELIKEEVKSFSPHVVIMGGSNGGAAMARRRATTTGDKRFHIGHHEFHIGNHEFHIGHHDSNHGYHDEEHSCERSKMLRELGSWMQDDKSLSCLVVVAYTP